MSFSKATTVRGEGKRSVLKNTAAGSGSRPGASPKSKMPTSEPKDPHGLGRRGGFGK